MSFHGCLVVAMLVVCQSYTPAVAQDRSGPAEEAASSGGVFVNPAGILVGLGSVELAFGVGDGVSLNLAGGYGISDDISLYQLGIGSQVFVTGSSLFQGAFVYPMLVFGQASTSGDAGSVNATVFGLSGLAGYQWDWQPFSLRLGGGAAYISGSASSGDTKVNSDGVRLVLDGSIGVTWGGASSPAKPAPRRARTPGHRQRYERPPDARRGQQARNRRGQQTRYRLAHQHDGTAEVELERVMPDGHHFLRVSQLAGGFQMRGCRGMTLETDGTRDKLVPRYLPGADHGQPTESMTAEVDLGHLARIGGANRAAISICGYEVLLMDGFKKPLSPSAAASSAPSPAEATTRTPQIAPATPAAVASGGTARGHIAVAGADLYLQGTPAESTTEVWLGVKVPTPPATQTQCRVTLLAAGEPVATGTFSAESGPGVVFYRARITVEELGRLVSAGRMAGKICDQRFALGPQDVAKVDDFLTLFREEVVFSGQ